MKLLLLGACVLLSLPQIHGAETLHTIVDDAWQGIQGYHFSGRLTELHTSARHDSGRMNTLYRNTRLLFASGEEGVVTWRVGAKEWTLRADDHGYWELAGNQPLDLSPGWHEIESDPKASSPAGLLVVDPRNTIGIISDIDDTILDTGVLSRRALLKNSLLVTPENRAAFPGMAQLYAQLVLKNPAPNATAVFYLSSSPRQLTDNLRRFLVAGGFPRGVLQLKEISTGSRDSLGDHDSYKFRQIETILAAYPNLRFYLFGDDAERDPEIYAKVQEKYPAQVVGVWIHRLNRNKNRPTYAGQRDVSELLLK